MDAGRTADGGVYARFVVGAGASTLYGGSLGFGSTSGGAAAMAAIYGTWVYAAARRS